METGDPSAEQGDLPLEPGVQPGEPCADPDPPPAWLSASRIRQVLDKVDSMITGNAINWHERCNYVSDVIDIVSQFEHDNKN